MKKKRMPIGIDNFSSIITQGFYYVDKTGMIKELLDNWGQVNLFTRPRRFGKSLNMSMLQHFFEIGTNISLFEGLEISKETNLCDAFMGKFPVISITLKQVAGRTYQRAEDNIKNILKLEARRFPFLLESDRLDEEDKEELRELRSGKSLVDSSLYSLSRLLCKHYGKRVIILIDEYDAPLQRAYENGYYDDMVKLIRQIFGYALKSNEFLYFSVLTGCMRISKESIFSDLNNPVIHSISDEQFDEWFGFTNAEMVRMLEDLDLLEYYEITREWYDGYRFGQQDVYCPWDAINWCNQLLNTSDRVPQNFWVNSGGTDVIRQFAEQADSMTRDQIGELIEGKTVRKKLTQELTYRDMMDQPENIWSILYTAGYLTYRKRFDDGSYELRIPNREVKNIFIAKVDAWFAARVLEDEDGLQEFFSAFVAGDAEALEDCLNYHLGESVSYLDGGNYEDKETFYHGLLLGMLNSRRGWEIKSNREAGKGRPDIVAFHLRKKDAYIIEVKYAKEESDLEAEAKDALEQIDRQLYDQYFSTRKAKSVIHYGIAFCKKMCKVLTE
ncbi:MAG: ATP-binding protein [Clostridiales bacterium]|nr:ATP-binding protein [Clostridiales bacterium]